jgi:hypothetical protein
MDVSLAADEWVQVDLVPVDQALVGEGVGELAAPAHEQVTGDLSFSLGIEFDLACRSKE